MGSLCAVVLVWATLIQGVLAAGTLDVKFINYRSNGRDNSGSCCDLFCSNPCDPYFRICIGPYSKGCLYYVRTSGVFHEQNNINFGGSIGGLANPIVVQTDSVPDAFYVWVITADNDPSSANDGIADNYVTWNVVDVAFNGSKGDYHMETFGISRATFKIGLRAYCHVYYYGEACDLYCKDDADGRYTCDPATGNVVCNEGWTDPNSNCTQDVNECRLNVTCPNGTICTDAALDCDGCYINNVCHNNTNCTSMQDAITCDGCYLLDVCHDDINCAQFLEELDCDGCYVNGSCQNGTNCTEDCEGCYIAGQCYNGTNCTDAGPECGGCLVAGVCHDMVNCSSIDWEPQCQGCEIDHVCQYGGICTNLPGSFNCTCQEGFEGDTCEETSHECVINPCKYGGVCTGNETSFTCDCLPWRNGTTCQEAVDTCDEAVCFNNGTCTSNNHTLPGYTCTCESEWGGPTCALIFGDPYNITLDGEITEDEKHDLKNGLIDLIKELGGVEGKVYVKVNNINTSTVNGDPVTTVVFQATGEKGPINTTVHDSILDNYTLDRINTYLLYPVYVYIAQPADQSQSWISSNWYIILIGVVVALVLVVILVVILVVTRRHWNRKLIFLRTESTVSTSPFISQTSTTESIAVENALYQRNTSVRDSDILNEADVTFNLDQQTRQLPSPNDPDPLYSDPIPETSHYDTPVKHVVENGQCGSGNQALDSTAQAGGNPKTDFNNLDTRCEAGSNPYTDFNNLDGANGVSKEECPYTDLDEIAIQKVINVVGQPEDLEETKSDAESEDSEEDIDKIKASFKEWHSEA